QLSSSPRSRRSATRPVWNRLRPRTHTRGTTGRGVSLQTPSGPSSAGRSSRADTRRPGRLKNGGRESGTRWSWRPQADFASPAEAGRHTLALVRLREPRLGNRRSIAPHTPVGGRRSIDGHIPNSGLRVGLDLRFAISRPTPRRDDEARTALHRL